MIQLTPKQWKTLLQYLGLGAAAYLVFLFLTFPTNLIKDWALGQIERQTGLPVQAKAMSLGFFSGVRLRGVQIDAAGGTLSLDQIQLRPRFLALLFGRSSASFSLRSADLAASGFFRGGKEKTSFEATIQKANLAGLLPALGVKGLQLTGTLAGSLNLEGPTAELRQLNLTKAKGQLSLSLPKPVIEESKVNLPQNPRLGAYAGMPFNLPRTLFQDLSLAAALDKGTLKLSKLALRGEDLSAAANGTVALTSSFPRASSTSTSN